MALSGDPRVMRPAVVALVCACGIATSPGAEAQESSGAATSVAPPESPESSSTASAPSTSTSAASATSAATTDGPEETTASVGDASSTSGGAESTTDDPGPLGRVFWECDFESDCEFSTTDWAEIGSFDAFGIPGPSGGGDNGIEWPVDAGQENTPNIDWYYGQYATDDFWARLYFYLSPGFTVTHNAGGLKFIRFMVTGSGEGDAGYKLGHSSGASNPGFEDVIQFRAWGAPNPMGFDGLLDAFPESGITTGEWHYVEFHLELRDGADLYEVWFDADARTEPPTATGDSIDAFPDGVIERVSLCQNWPYLSPADQSIYFDGFKAATGGPVGDEYGVAD